MSNSPTPILSDSLGGWYACESGVWYAAPSVTGPWSVATSIPASIYSIPASSPVYYVTHVKIYTVTFPPLMTKAEFDEFGALGTP